MDSLLNLSSTQRLLITIAVMTATFMQILDTTIVTVALPYMQGSLAANPDEITWTLTSYLVASAIFMPLTGYLSDRLGAKQYLLISIVGFTVASALCGASQTLTQIVLFRLLQGVFGASLVPLSQAILTEIYPREQRTKAMAIWGFGVMVAPILGPTLGGYLTDVDSWRWTFYVNIPFGVFAFLLAWRVMPKTPAQPRLMDWLGLGFISLSIAAFQYVLDQGNDRDWFSAWDIRIAGLLTIGGIAAFIVHTLFKPERIVFDLNMFKDRNFSVACLLITMMGLGMYGIMAVQPLLLENLMNYPVLLAGLVMAPRGISGMLGMVFMGKYGHFFDSRLMVLIGIVLNILGIYIYTQLPLEVTPAYLIWPMLLQGFGVSMIFTALSAVAFATLPSELSVEGSGLFNLVRTLGSSIGISLTVSVLTHQGQVSWNQLGGWINPYNAALPHYLTALHLSPTSPAGVQVLGLTLLNQSQMVAFDSTFVFVMWSFILMLPFVFLMQKPKSNLKPAAMMGE